MYTFINSELERISWSKRTLADEMGVSLSTVYAIVNGKKAISHHVAKKLSHALGRSTDFWLLNAVHLESINLIGGKGQAKKEIKSIIKLVRNSISKEKISTILKSLGEYTGNDDKKPGNYHVIGISTVELEMIRHCLILTSLTKDIPNWSQETVMMLDGVLAVLNKFSEFIPKQLIKSWDESIKGLQRALDQLRSSSDED